MSSSTLLRNWLLLLSVLALDVSPAHPQTTLTGAMWFATTPTGGTSVSQAYADGASNTLGGDQWWDLWLALDPNATLPVNGPSDEQSSISIPLEEGKLYKYYLFAQGPCCTLSYSGLNLFFDGNNSTPGISVYGVLNTTNFLPNANIGTFTLSAGIVPGSGTGFYNAGGVTVVLTGYQWNGSGTLDVCQAFAFSPGSEPSSVGSVTLQVFPAGTLTSSLSSGFPGTGITLTGSGFLPLERVIIFFGGFGAPPFDIATADASGGFSVTALVPQLPHGPEDVYAVGRSSGRLGAVSVYVTPRLIVRPSFGNPGGYETAQGAGFGASEPVDVYWGNPRQLLGTAAANSIGSFSESGSLPFSIPTNAAPGINAVVGIGKTTGAVAIGEIEVK
jgi:hypothetical protein